MKTHRHLYSQVHDWDNLYLAWRKARKGKRSRPPAATFEFNLEANLLQLERELAEKTYAPGPYTSFYIHEPKRRLISANEGIPFLGFVLHPTHRRLKRRKVIYFRRRLKGLVASYHAGDLSKDQLDASIQGWVNHARYGDTWGLRRAMFNDLCL